FSVAYAQNSAVSCTGMPSVMTIARGIRASIASMTAAFAPAGGTKITETSAPVAAIVSATVPKTGTSVPLSPTVWPAFLGLVPPTTVVPAASMRAPCLRPSPPVMPWIRTRLRSVRKIATSCSLRGASRTRPGQLGRPPRRAIHRVLLLDDRQGGVVQDLPALGRLVAIQPDHDRAVDRLPALAQQGQGGDDAVGHRVTGGDPAEDVHEHRLDGRVGQHDLQAVGHHLSRRAAADVQEVRRADPAELLTRVGDHVQRGHDQAG